MMLSIFSGHVGHVCVLFGWMSIQVCWVYLSIGLFVGVFFFFATTELYEFFMYYGHINPHIIVR